MVAIRAFNSHTHNRGTEGGNYPGQHLGKLRCSTAQPDFFFSWCVAGFKLVNLDLESSWTLPTQLTAMCITFVVVIVLLN